MEIPAGLTLLLYEINIEQLSQTNVKYILLKIFSSNPKLVQISLAGKVNMENQIFKLPSEFVIEANIKCQPF